MDDRAEWVSLSAAGREELCVEIARTHQENVAPAGFEVLGGDDLNV